MLKIERHKIIEEHLKEKGSVMVSALCEELAVTEETIRRDLEEMEQQKKLKRVRGGAYLPHEFDREVPIQIRENIYQKEKDRIAKAALELIETNESIMLDSSTTAYQIAIRMKEARTKVTIITNSLKICQLMENSPYIKTICTGGVLRHSSDSFVGYNATESLKQYYADKAFVSCSTLTIQHGITDHSSREAELRKIMLNNAKDCYLVIDHTKFDTPSLYKIGDISDVQNIIVDQCLDHENEQAIEKLGIKLIIA